jgi:hypothetical protein
LGAEGRSALRAEKVGVSPEWFYKGNGTILAVPIDRPLEVPQFALGRWRRGEVLAAYIIDSMGVPRRVGLMLGNEFSDHRLESKNYLYLAHSKLRTCAIGPELIVDADFRDARGITRILR